MRVYGTGELITIDMPGDEVKIKVSAYAGKCREEVMTAYSKQSGNVVEDSIRSAKLQMKYLIKDVEGLTADDEGTPYELKKDENGYLSDETIDDLLNLPISAKLNRALMCFLSGIPSVLIDPETKEKIEGVELVMPKSLPKK